MKTARAYKTEIAPTKEQQIIFDNWMRTARFVWNRALDIRSTAYKERGVSMTMQGTKAEKKERSLQTYIQDLKNEGDDDTPIEAIEALKNVPSSLFLAVLMDQDKAFTAFFRGQRGYPKFKNKRQDSFRVYGGIQIENARIKLPKSAGWVKLKEKGYLPTPDKLTGKEEKVIAATISRRAGRWFVSVSVYEQHEPPKVKSDKVVSVHPGVRQFVTTSDGHIFDHHRAIEQERKKLRRWQRRKARRKKGSANRWKAVQEIQKIHARIANIREWNTHHASHKIATNGLATMVLQEWDVKGMVERKDGKKHNRRLREAIHDSNFYELRRQLTYKGEWNGKEVVTLERDHPVTKRCSGCGNVKDEFPLSKVIYTCDKCGLSIDREENAVQNMLYYYSCLDN